MECFCSFIQSEEANVSCACLQEQDAGSSQTSREQHIKKVRIDIWSADLLQGPKQIKIQHTKKLTIFVHTQKM